MYDLAVIGSGWAGFNAALKAKAYGLKVCLIERGNIGGTCLNRGCIPTKSLISCTKVYSTLKKSSNFGVNCDNPRFDFLKIQERKDNLVRLLAEGMRGRITGIDFINSAAQILPDCRIKVEGQIVSSRFILVATGSRPAELDGFKFDGRKIISSDEALSLAEFPRSLMIIGGGVIGCEFASLFSALGSEVSIVEKFPALLPGEDGDVSRKIETIFKKKGIKVSTGAEPSEIDTGAYDKILVCVGRKAEFSGLGLENIGVKTGKGIVVDDYLKTDAKNVFAAGDCTAQVMLAHYAAYQGTEAVENMFSAIPRKANNRVVPACVFCDPEIASVGMNEDKARAAGLAVKVHKFDFRASAMARIIDEAEGFIKILSGQGTEEVVGGCIIGPKATELIAIVAMAVSLRLKVSQLRQVIFAHPTLSESVREALS